MKIKNKVNVSYVIATLNSAKTLGLVLKSIRGQNYPQNKVEILVIDGGSTDKTIKISHKYNCRVLSNPMVDQVFAKYIGFKNAKGKYIVLQDSDEVSVSKESLRKKVDAISKNIKIRSISSSGMIQPLNYSNINYYINEFGDPFSFFLYRNSKDYKRYIGELKAKFESAYVNKDFIAFDFTKVSNPPFIELTGMSTMLDLVYLKKEFPDIFKYPYLHTHNYYLLLSKKGNLHAVVKNDPVMHYSATSLSKYLRKIKSRIKNNVYLTEMGKAGFSGRNIYQSKEVNIKKYFFIPYSLTLIFPIIDAFILTLTRRNYSYLLHPFLCIYTSICILYYKLLKLIKVTPKLKGYGTD